MSSNGAEFHVGAKVHAKAIHVTCSPQPLNVIDIMEMQKPRMSMGLLSHLIQSHPQPRSVLWLLLLPTMTWVGIPSDTFK
jgi:hypothetical protein